jgi:RNA polymerase sigma factor (sigma-70 family)
MDTGATNYLKALLQNDESILKVLYAEMLPSVTAYVVQNNGTEAEASDIFQDALLAVFQKAKAGQLEINTGFQPYLFAVCRNLWLMQLRKKLVRRVTNMGERQHDIATDSFGEAEQTANRYARQQLIEKMTLQLGDGCRKLLQLAWSGKPLEEVARLLHNSYAYVRKKKSECMGKLAALVRNSVEFNHLKW